MHHELNNTGHPSIVLTLLLIPLLVGDKALAADNLSFRGQLVSEPCTLRPGDEALTLDMNDVSTQYLYANSRTTGSPFNIHLEGCDTSIADSVTTTFSGTPNPALPGLLALDGSSVAKGIALGIETTDNVQVPLNVPSDELALSNGSNVIAFKAYVIGEPQALADKTVNAGLFRATSTFTLDYP